MSFKCIICGSRTFSDYTIAKKVLSKILGKYQFDGYFLPPSDVTIISGHAKGADLVGERWGKAYGMKIKIFEADWKNLEVENVLVKSNNYGKYNALAGMNRNQQMLDYATENDDFAIIIAFYKGESKGSKSMVRIAKKAGLDYYIYDADKGKLRGTK